MREVYITIDKSSVNFEHSLNIVKPTSLWHVNATRLEFLEIIRAHINFLNTLYWCHSNSFVGGWRKTVPSFVSFVWIKSLEMPMSSKSGIWSTMYREHVIGAFFFFFFNCYLIWFDLCWQSIYTGIVDLLNSPPRECNTSITYGHPTMACEIHIVYKLSKCI